MWKYFTWRLRMVVLSIFAAEVLFFFFLLRVWTLQDAVVSLRSLPIKSIQRVARDVIFTTATHTSRVHDDTELVKMAALMALFSWVSNVDFFFTNYYFQTSIFSKLYTYHRSTENCCKCLFACFVPFLRVTFLREQVAWSAVTATGGHRGRWVVIIPTGTG